MRHVLPTLLQLAGIAAVVAGGFMLCLAAGVVAAGVAAFVVGLALDTEAA